MRGPEVKPDTFVMGSCPIAHPACPCTTNAPASGDPLRQLSVLLDRVASVTLSRVTKKDTILLDVCIVTRNEKALELRHAIDARSVRQMHGDPLALVLGEVLSQLSRDLT